MLVKHYSTDLFDETLNLNFPDATEAYNEFIQKIMVALDKEVPITESRAT